MVILDYLFFRIYTFYKSSSDKNPQWMGALIISLLLYLTLLSICSLLTIFLKFEINHNALKPILLLLMILIFLPIWVRYKRKEFIYELEARYSVEYSKRKSLRGWILVLYLILVLVIPLCIGFMRYNLGMKI